MIDGISTGNACRSEEDGQEVKEYEEQIHQLVENALHGGDATKIRWLTRVMHDFVETLQLHCAVSPRIEECLEREEAIIAHPDFQDMLMDIVLTLAKTWRIEYFLRLSVEYPGIFPIQQAIIQNKIIQIHLRARIILLEETGQNSMADLLRAYIRW